MCYVVRSLENELGPRNSVTFFIVLYLIYFSWNSIKLIAYVINDKRVGEKINACFFLFGILYKIFHRKPVLMKTVAIVMFAKKTKKGKTN